QPPSEMNRFCSCRHEVERLLPWASAAVRPGNAIGDGIRSINCDGAIEIDGYGATPTPIIRVCPQPHLCHLPIWSRITSGRGHEHQPRTQNNQGCKNPSAAN